MVNNHKGLYCSLCDNKYQMHAQVGIDTDGTDDAPGCRIPVGFEHELFKRIFVFTSLPE